MAPNAADRKPSRAALRRIRLLALDVDGVLSDGRIIYDESGAEFKVFDAMDGYGIRKALGAGIIVALISGRKSKVVVRRARELGIAEVHQGVTDKLVVLRSLLGKYRLSDADACCVGDDEPDIPMLRAAGVSAAPPGAATAVRRSVDFVTAAGGGRGSVREVIELILRARSRG